MFLTELNNHIVVGASFEKEWDFDTIYHYLKSLFPSKLSEFDNITNLPPWQQLSAFILHKVFKDRPVYIRPNTCILSMDNPPNKSNGRTMASCSHPMIVPL